MTSLTLDESLHVLEILSIVGGGFLVAFRMGRFAQAIQDANRAFVEKMQESKEDRASMHHELRAISELLTNQRVSDTRITAHDERLNKIEAWYDELRRGIGKIN